LASNSSNGRRAATASPPRQRGALTPRSLSNRSRVSNGKEILPGIDQRSQVARRYHDIASAIAVDQGGADRLSETRLQLVRRFAAAAVLAEQLEARLANGEQINITEHAHLSSTLCRLAMRIGINRVAKNVTPSLSEILREGQRDL